MSSRRRPHRGGVGGFEPRPVIAARAHRAWELAVLGWSQREIAADLQVSQAAVSRMLRRTAEALAADDRDAHGRLRARLMARHEHVFKEALRGYERSQTERTRRRQRQVTGAEGRDQRTTIEADVVARDGDPRFLEQAGRALEREAQLFGLDGGDARHREVAAYDPEEARRRLAGRLARLAPPRSNRSVDPKAR